MAKSAVRRTSMLDNVATHLGTSCLNHQFLSWISHRVEWLVWLRGSASVPGAGCVRVQCRAESELVVGMFTMRGLTPVIIVRSGRHRPVLSGMAPCPAILTREREMRAGRDDPCKFGTNRAIGRVGGLLRLETDLAQAFEPHVSRGGEPQAELMSARGVREGAVPSASQYRSQERHLERIEIGAAREEQEPCCLLRGSPRSPRSCGWPGRR